MACSGSAPKGQLFARATDGRVTAHRLFDRAEGARIRTILPDRDGQLWLGIDGGPGGLIRLHRQSLSVLTYEDGLPCNNAAPILQGLDGTMWIGTICIPGGVTSIAGAKTQTFGIALGSAVAGHRSRPGAVGGKQAGQLFRLEGRQFVRVPGPQSMTLGAISALYAEPSGDIWVGAARGLFHLHDGEWTSYLTDDGLPGNEVLTIAAASRRSAVDRHHRWREPLRERHVHQHHACSGIAGGAGARYSSRHRRRRLDRHLWRRPESSQGWTSDGIR